MSLVYHQNLSPAHIITGLLKHLPVQLLSNEAATPLYRFAAPRYWGAWFGFGLLRLSTLLPYRQQQGLGRALGVLLYRIMATRREVARRNLQICFPQLEEKRREDLAKRHFENLGKSVFDSVLAWWGRDDKLKPLAKVEGIEHLESGLAAGNGVILLGAHLGPLDMGGRLLSFCTPFKVVFRPLAHPLANEIMRRGRLRYGESHIHKQNFRALLRALRNNGVVWYAPDQAHQGANSAQVDFFSVPAPTNTTTSRLAKASGAAVVPFFATRRKDGMGFLLRFHPPLRAFPSSDAIQDAARINRIFEREILETPEQYYWIHRRFKGSHRYPGMDPAGS